MSDPKKPFMSKWRRDAIKREHAQNATRRQRGASSAPASPLTDPAYPGSVYYTHQTNHFYPDGSYTSESSQSSDSGYSSRSESSYDHGSSSSSSYDSGSCGGGE